MKRKTVLAVGVAMVGLAAVGMTLRPQAVPAAERPPHGEGAKAEQGKGNKGAIAVDVVIEEVDLSANTITARTTAHVVPPHGGVGGAVFMPGTTDSPHKDKTTKFVRLPVMPEADLKDKKWRAGVHAILRLDVLRQGSLVVVGIEAFTGLERVGVEWLDAPGATGGP